MPFKDEFQSFQAALLNLSRPPRRFLHDILKLSPKKASERPYLPLVIGAFYDTAHETRMMRAKKGRIY
jgi:hypothetical protein